MASIHEALMPLPITGNITVKRLFDLYLG